MITDQNIKRILCFGDSNTWGWIPGSSGGPEGRFPFNIRWTGILQGLLGSKYLVIEEGLPARTIAWDDPRPDKPGKNGKTYLVPCLETQTPLDWIILFLGTCDTKPIFGYEPNEIASAYRGLVELIRNSKLNTHPKLPQIIVVSPPQILEDVPFTQTLYLGASGKIPILQELYNKISQEFDCEFVAAADVVETSKADGLHLDPPEHQKFAKAIAEVITKRKL